MKRHDTITCSIAAIAMWAIGPGCFESDPPDPQKPQPSATHPHKLTHGSAVSVNMDATVLAQAAQVVQDAVDSGPLDGAVLLVARHGKVVLHQAFGNRDGNPLDPNGDPWPGMLADGTMDPDPTVPMPLDGIFDLASMTKPFTAFLALTMDANEQSYPDFDISDLVSDYIPSFANDPLKASMTIRDLMRYASGYDIDTAAPLYDPPPVNPDPWQHMIDEPLTGSPGTFVLYSDLGYRLLGHILQQMAGEDLDDLMKAELFVPMGMVDTSFQPHAEMPSEAHRFVGNKYSAQRGYYPRGEVIDDNDQYAESYSINPAGDTHDTGCDGLFSTAWDLAVFQQMMLNRGLHVTGYQCSSLGGNSSGGADPCEKNPSGVTMLDSTMTDMMTDIQTGEIQGVPATTSRFTDNLLFTHKAYGWEQPEPGNWPGGAAYVSTSYSKTGGAGTLVVAHPEPTLDYFYILLTNRGYPDFDYYIDNNGTPDDSSDDYFVWPDFEDLIIDMHAEQVGDIIASSLTDTMLL